MKVRLPLSWLATLALVVAAGCSGGNAGDAVTEQADVTDAIRLERLVAGARSPAVVRGFSNESQVTLEFGPIEPAPQSGGVSQPRTVSSCTFVSTDMVAFSLAAVEGLFVWDLARATVEELGSVSFVPWGMHWAAASSQLFVLEAGGRVHTLRNDGKPTGSFFLVSGQGVVDAVPLEENVILGAGATAQSNLERYLLTKYDRATSEFTRFFLQDVQTIRDLSYLYDPVLISVFAANRIAVAEPTVPRITVISDDGEVIHQFEIEADGYLPPTARPVGNAVLEQWMESWTPLLFLHATPTLMFAGFDMQPLRGDLYELLVLDGQGREVEEVEFPLTPVCGNGRLIVGATSSGPGTVGLYALEYTGEAEN